MEMIAANEAKTHLGRLLERVARGEHLIITRHGKPVAQLIPVSADRQRARQGAARMVERRRHLKRAPLAELMATIHEGHRY